MFTKKIDLSQVVNEFLSKERERNDKIQSKIVELERNSGTLNRSISSETDALVECELNDDAAGAEKCRKNIRELRTSLTETEDLITGYKKQLELSPSREKEIANIREVAVKSRKERSDAAADIQSERENLNQQMTELQRKIEQLDHEHRQMTDDHETAVLRRILPLIEPRMIGQQHSLDVDSFLRGWMQGQDREEFFTTNLRH